MAVRFRGLPAGDPLPRSHLEPILRARPEGNGCAERSFRPLNEQLLGLRFLPTVAELSEAFAEVRIRYNQRWRLERHGYRSPAAVRAAFIALENAA